MLLLAFLTFSSLISNLILFSSVGVIMLVEISPRAAESHTGNFAEPTSKKMGDLFKTPTKSPLFRPF
jgi:hypothetical protein